MLLHATLSLTSWQTATAFLVPAKQQIITAKQEFGHYLLKRGSPPRRRRSPSADPWGPCRRQCSRR